MNSKLFSEALGHIDSRYVEEAAWYRKETGKRKLWIKRAVSAACFVLAFAAGFFAADWKHSQIPLSDKSVHVTARYNEKGDWPESVACLVSLTEEELFTRLNTAIFKGTIQEMRNIELNFRGEKEYCVIAEITVEKVYRGPCGVGGTVSVMIPDLNINDRGSVTATDTVSAMEEGMTGIFMPEVLDDENCVWERNGGKLDKRDLADYSFADGERYAFLEKKKLIFDRGAYAGITDAKELSEVEDYIQAMLKKFSASGQDGE